MSASRIIMVLSSVIMGVVALLLIFLTGEAAAWMNLGEQGAPLLQITGSLYFGFALANWTARGSILGGIYGRALLFGNFGHFFTAGIFLVKLASGEPELPYLMAAMVYAVFAIAFGYLLVYSSGIKNRN